MTNAKSAKKIFLVSTIAILISAAMLVGATFAWFTDSVTGGKNRIVAGNLDVELEYLTGDDPTDDADWTPVGEDTNLFADILWEPGMVVTQTFRVKNEGTLALKYSLGLSIDDYNTVKVNGVKHSLAEVLAVGSTDEIPENRDAAAKAAVTNLAAYSVAKSNDDLAVGASDTFTVVLYWAPGVLDDNLYNINNKKVTSDGNPLYINLGVTLLATQAVDESDSFNNEYDKDAEYDRLPVVSVTPDNFDDVDFTREDTIFNITGEYPDGIDLSDKEIPDSSALTFSRVEVSTILLPDGATVTGNNYLTFIDGDEDAVKAFVAKGKLTFADGKLDVEGASYVVYSDIQNADVTFDGMTVITDNAAGIKLTNASKEGKTGENTATLTIVDSDLALCGDEGNGNGINANIEVRSSNGTAKVEIENSSLVCGSLFVGAHSMNEPYTVATLNVTDSYISCRENALGSTIMVEGREEANALIENSEIHTYSQGWHQSEDANDNSITVQSGGKVDARIVNSNLFLYGARSLINAREYNFTHNENFERSLVIENCFIWEVSKGTHLPIWNGDVAIEDMVKDTVVVSVVNVYNGNGSDPIITTTVYGNPTVSGAFTLDTQTYWALDINVADQTVTFKADAKLTNVVEGTAAHRFVIGEGGRIVVEDGAEVGIPIVAADGLELVTTHINGATVYTAK